MTDPLWGLKQDLYFRKTGMIQKEVGIHFGARHNLGKKLAFWDKALEYGIGSNRRFKPFLDGRGTFPTERNQLYMPAQKPQLHGF